MEVSAVFQMQGLSCRGMAMWTLEISIKCSWLIKQGKTKPGSFKNKFRFVFQQESMFHQ